MTADELVERHPRLYHMAEAGTWAQIARQGLLSASALLDLFEVDAVCRRRLQATPRRASVVLEHPLRGRATLRDQLPLCTPGFERSLAGMTPGEWLRLLNAHVFFWADEARLSRLLQARLFRDRPHDVIVVDTRRLVERHPGRLRVSHINSGYAGRKPATRGAATFEGLSRARRRRIAEVVVRHGLPDIADLALRVERRSADGVETIWSRSRS